eukprot:Tamp_07753.p4 GENE.Tamp_07753~~Tamp_07753.p4  ORF type:complete len:116 (-),score=22.64 Tamp_07753:882-1229(-)
MPLQPFLDNGCQLEYLRLDSQVDETAKDFPTDLCPHTLRQIQYTVFNELSTLYKDEWIDYSPGRTFEDFLLRWDKGTLFEVSACRGFQRADFSFRLCCRDSRFGVFSPFAYVLGI